MGAKHFKSRLFTDFDPRMLRSILGNKVHRATFANNSSTQATGASGDSDYKITVDYLCVFDGITKAAQGIALTLEATVGSAVLASGEAKAYPVIAVLGADNAVSLRVLTTGAKGSTYTFAQSLVAGGWLAAARALFSADKKRVQLLGAVRVHRSADTTVALTFDYSWQASQFFDAALKTGEDAFADVL